MRFDLITIFPEFFAGPLEHGIVRRASESGIVEIHVQDLRIFTKDRHRTVDDRPFGGGEGMVLKAAPHIRMRPSRRRRSCLCRRRGNCLGRRRRGVSPSWSASFLSAGGMREWMSESRNISPPKKSRSAISY